MVKRQPQINLYETRQEARTAHSTYKKLTVQWLNEALCCVSSSVLADSLVLRNRDERRLNISLNRDRIRLPYKLSISLAEKYLASIHTNSFPLAPGGP